MQKFQKRYELHEYPGRKPWYVVREYIENYSKPGENVLDPFCGSGVVPCESLILKRKAKALDIDPFAVFISKMTCFASVDLDELKKDFQRVDESSKDSLSKIYKIEEKCSFCHEQLIFVSGFHDSNAHKVNIKAVCPICGKFEQVVYDINKWHDRDNDSDELIYWHPGEIELPSGICGNIRYIHELYTKRNLKSLAILWHSISLIEAGINKELLKLCFSANLSKANKFNVPKTKGKGWTASDYGVYNVPDSFMEFNIWDGFYNKFQLCLEAKAQTNQLIGSFFGSKGAFEILVSSVHDMNFIPDNSISFVLTDPPYENLVRYYERHFVRNAWLGFENCYPLMDYETLMPRALGEIHRVLKKGRKLSVMFKNTSQDFRGTFVTMAKDAGLEHIGTDEVNLGYSEKSDSSSDYIINFVKPI